MEAFKNYILTNHSNANIVHINFNLPEYDEFTEYRPLYDYIKSQYKEGTDNFVLIDEIQMCNNFEKAINGLHASEQFDLYITGSDAFLLSSDLATLFTGRTFEIKVYPFSFAEYIKYFSYTDLYEAFDKYVLEGGVCQVLICTGIMKRNMITSKKYSIRLLPGIYVQSTKSGTLR